MKYPIRRRMRWSLVLIFTLVIGQSIVNAKNSNEKSRWKVGRKKLLLNLLRALRTLRDHKKVRSTTISLSENHVASASNSSPTMTKNIGVITDNNQIIKRSKGIHEELPGNHGSKRRNGKETFIQLLKTLRSIKKRKNEKHDRNSHRWILHNSRPHNRQIIPAFNQRSSLLKPVKKVAKIGASQANKARYFFARARLSFLQALETAQDHKLSKLGDLEKKFSYIFPKGDGANAQNVGKGVKLALKDFTRDQPATALSHIHQPYKKLEKSKSAMAIKHSVLGKPLMNPKFKEHNFTAPWPGSLPVKNKIEKRRKEISMSNVTKSTHKEKYHEIFPSIMDELLSISNAGSKLEKLKLLRRLRAKLLNHFKEKKKNHEKKNHKISLHDYDSKPSKETKPTKKNKEEHKGPALKWKSGISLLDNVLLKKTSNRHNDTASQKIVHREGGKRYKPESDSKISSAKHFLLPSNNLNHSISHTKGEQLVAKPVKEYIDTYDDFLQASRNVNHTLNNTSKNFAYGAAKVSQFESGSMLKGKQNKSIVASFRTNGNNITNQKTIKDEVHGTEISSMQNNKQRVDSDQHTAKDLSHSHDTNIIGTISNNQSTTESDQSFLPLDSPKMTSHSKPTDDSKNPLASVVSEHKKILSELTSSKILPKHLSNTKSEKSQKALSNVLEKAQNMFLKKVKEILAGSNAKGKEKNDPHIVGNENRNNAKKPKGGVINTSAYVMDESPTDTKTANKVSQDTSGIVPKTPTNDDLMKSVNMVAATTQKQNVGMNAPMQSLQTPMQSLQTPIDQTPPLHEQSSEQTEQAGHPVSGQPLTYQQLQDAHEEERVALQQENAFRGLQNGVNPALVSGRHQLLNGAMTPYQRYMGLNQIHEANHFPISHSRFHTPNIDDLSEYRGGIERYQLSHRIGYDGNLGQETEDDYPSTRHHLRLYGHRYSDDEDDDDEDYDDFDDDDNVDEDEKKKSNIRKPQHSSKRRHLRKRQFQNSPNISTTDHVKYVKTSVVRKVNHTANATTNAERTQRKIKH